MIISAVVLQKQFYQKGQRADSSGPLKQMVCNVVEYKTIKL